MEATNENTTAHGSGSSGSASDEDLNENGKRSSESAGIRERSALTRVFELFSQPECTLLSQFQDPELLLSIREHVNMLYRAGAFSVLRRGETVEILHHTYGLGLNSEDSPYRLGEDYQIGSMKVDIKVKLSALILQMSNAKVFRLERNGSRTRQIGDGALFKHEYEFVFELPDHQLNQEISLDFVDAIRERLNTAITVLFSTKRCPRKNEGLGLGRRYLCGRPVSSSQDFCLSCCIKDRHVSAIQNRWKKQKKSDARD